MAKQLLLPSDWLPAEIAQFLKPHPPRVGEE
jgi:hypothetical protein